MPKMTVTTNDGRFIADFEIGDVDPIDDQPEIDEVLREAFESAPGLLGASVATDPSRAGTRPAGGGSGASPQPPVVRVMGSGGPRRRFDLS